MNQIEALQKIQSLGTPAFETRDVATLLRASPANASLLLRRLTDGGFLHKVARGRWTTVTKGTREHLMEQLAAPYPAYVSLQSALFRHGLVEQVPAVLYAVTLGRARRWDTPLGTISFHRLPAGLFGGFVTADDGTKRASAEKALFDLAYLSPTRSRLFTSLPELELPKSFHWSEVRCWTQKIAGQNRRTFVEQKLAAYR